MSQNLDFIATRQLVSNRGAAPISFLQQLVAWGRTAPDEYFAPNPAPRDIYWLLKPVLGPWDGLEHRRAAMLEAMRVHAGFESSWNWEEGVDTTNHASMENTSGQEAGIFQVSFDSIRIADSLREFCVGKGLDTAKQFITAMKEDHVLAMDYYARLVRINISWAGPLVHGKILAYLRRDAMEEFQTMLA